MVVDVTTRAVVEDVGFVATVEPSVSTTVSVEVAGQVKELLVQEGQHVTAGSTVMARLDTTSREIQLRETEAARTKAREQLAMLRRGTRAEEVALREAAMAEQQALLARAEAEFQRARQLFQDQLISRSELERLQADYLAVRQKHEAALQAFDLDRSITLTANVREDIPLEAALGLAEARAVGPARRALPLGYTITLTGQAKELGEAWNALKWIYVLALVVIYLLMCSLFESWTLPLYIMFTVPLAMTGAVLALRLAGLGEPSTRMDTVTMLGFVILAGTVVNSAILIVHQALNNMAAGQAPQEALLASVESRIRPIFITTTTTVFGMLPLVLSTGAGSELYRGLGSAVLGGLAASTLFTLILVPVLFSLGLDLSGAWGRARDSLPVESPPPAAGS
jgi:multidrug efflux pump subunit AcrB